MATLGFYVQTEKVKPDNMDQDLLQRGKGILDEKWSEIVIIFSLLCSFNS